MGYLVAPDLYPHPGNDLVEMANLFWIAKEAGVPAWELAQQPPIYYEMYKLITEVETEKQKERLKRHA